MEAGPNLQPEVTHALGDDTSASNSATRSVERGQEAVSRSVDLSTLESLQLSSDYAVVCFESLAPSPVTERRCSRRRTYDVREQHRRQDAVGANWEPRSRDEGLDLGENCVAVRAGEVGVGVTGKLDETSIRDSSAQVARSVDVGYGVASSVHHQGRDVDTGEHVAHVNETVHALERRQSRRTD